MRSGKQSKTQRGLRAAAMAPVLLGILLFSACSGSGNPIRGQYFPEEYQVKNHTDGKNSAFGLNIAPAEEMGDWVADWLSGVTAGDGFQYFVYADPDSWDVYLYYPEKQAEIAALTNDDVSVEYAGGTLSVYVTACREEDGAADGSLTEDGAKEGGLAENGAAEGGLAENGKVWILHFAAYPLGAWPSEIRLYWNGCEIP